MAAYDDLIMSTNTNTKKLQRSTSTDEPAVKGGLVTQKYCDINQCCVLGLKNVESAASLSCADKKDQLHTNDNNTVDEFSNFSALTKRFSEPFAKSLSTDNQPASAPVPIAINPSVARISKREQPLLVGMSPRRTRVTNQSPMVTPTSSQGADSAYASRSSVSSASVVKDDTSKPTSSNAMLVKSTKPIKIKEPKVKATTDFAQKSDADTRLSILAGIKYNFHHSTF